MNITLIRNYEVFLVITLLAGLVTGLLFPFVIVGAQECDGSQHHFECDNTNVNIDRVNINRNQVPMNEVQQLESLNGPINKNTETNPSRVPPFA